MTTAAAAEPATDTEDVEAPEVEAAAEADAETAAADADPTDATADDGATPDEEETK